MKRLNLHHGKARYQVAGGGRSLKVSRVAVNALYKSRTAKKKSAMQLGVWAWS
jgi:hypothetical protein